MVLEAFGQDRLHTAGDLRDKRRVRGVGRRGLERVPHVDDAAVDDLHKPDQQAQQGRFAADISVERYVPV